MKKQKWEGQIEKVQMEYTISAGEHDPVATGPMNIMVGNSEIPIDKTDCLSYGLREQRNKLFSGMTEYDLGIEGTAVQNPLIGYIPDRYEVEDELEQLLLMM